MRALILDVDGTMTDGGMYYGADGQVMKRFDVRDGMGVWLLRQAGVEVVIITGDHTPIIEARARVLGVERVAMGQDDKASALRDAIEAHGWRAEEVVYMGDDVNDLGAMAVAGVTAAPADAVPEVRAIVDYLATSEGGRGAVREVCDLIMAHNARLP